MSDLIVNVTHEIQWTRPGTAAATVLGWPWWTAPMLSAALVIASVAIGVVVVNWLVNRASRRDQDS